MRKCWAFCGVLWLVESGQEVQGHLSASDKSADNVNLAPHSPYPDDKMTSSKNYCRLSFFNRTLIYKST